MNKTHFQTTSESGQAGDWLVIVAHMCRQFGLESPLANPEHVTWRWFSLERYRLQGLPLYWIYSNLFGFGMWFTVGGFLQWYFYVHRGHEPEQWKCQPRRQLTAAQELDEFLWGCVGLLTTSSGSAVISCYLVNGGRSALYYRLADYPLWWTILQWPALFIVQDYFTYWAHRTFHTPTLYTRFHKLHHRYKSPTCWSVTAFKPLEIFIMQLVLAAPLCFLPTHWVTFITVGVYTFYNAILDHSGIIFIASKYHFWKPDSIFHDNHHQYTHVNFGFNCIYWDKLHGTYRKTDHIYKEDVYYGHGKPLLEATEEELKEEAEERLAENLAAHKRLKHILLE